MMNEDTATRFRRFVRNPAFTWIGLLIAWKLFGPLFDPLFTFALNILYPGAHYG